MLIFLEALQRPHFGINNENFNTLFKNDISPAQNMRNKLWIGLTSKPPNNDDFFLSMYKLYRTRRYSLRKRKHCIFLAKMITLFKSFTNPKHQAFISNLQQKFIYFNIIPYSAMQEVLYYELGIENNILIYNTNDGQIVS